MEWNGGRRTHQLEEDWRLGFPSVLHAPVVPLIWLQISRVPMSNFLPWIRRTRIGESIAKAWPWKAVSTANLKVSRRDAAKRPASLANSLWKGKIPCPGCATCFAMVVQICSELQTLGWSSCACRRLPSLLDLQISYLCSIITMATVEIHAIHKDT